MTIETQKFIICVLTIVSGSFLGYTQVVSSEATVGIITGVLGYVFGNGHGLISADKAMTLIGKKPK